MKKRKQRLVVEVTFSHPVTEKQAKHYTQDVLDARLDLEEGAVANTEPWMYLERIKTKQFGVTFRALARPLFHKWSFDRGFHAAYAILREAVANNRFGYPAGSTPDQALLHQKSSLLRTMAEAAKTPREFLDGN